jgi:hypothetical protein
MDKKTIDAILNDLNEQESGWFAAQVTALKQGGEKDIAHDFGVMANAVGNARRRIQALVETAAAQASTNADVASPVASTITIAVTYDVVKNCIILDGDLIHQSIQKASENHNAASL